MVKSRVPVLSSVGGNFASSAGELPGNTSGPLAFAPLKYTGSDSFKGDVGGGSPSRTGATQAESPPSSITEPQKVPMAPGTGSFSWINQATASPVSMPPAEQP